MDHIQHSTGTEAPSTFRDNQFMSQPEMTAPYMPSDAAIAEKARTRRIVDKRIATVTAVHVARDWAIEQRGNRFAIAGLVEHYMRSWLLRNGAVGAPAFDFNSNVSDLVDAVWALAELPQQDPLTLLDDDYRGTSEEARDMLTAQYELDLNHALNRITWKA